MSMGSAPSLYPMCPIPAQIAEVARETRDTYTLTAIPVDSATLPSFRPGQFSMVSAHGVGEVPLSISGDAGIPDRLTYTIRAIGKATEALVKHKAGDYIGIRSSFGTAWPLEAARERDVLLVAGGIGLAPLRPVICHIASHRSDYGRLFVLYGARSPKELLFRTQLAAWDALPDTQVLTTVDCADPKWRGHVGVVTMLLDFVQLRQERIIAMICGPEIMMRFTVQALRAKNVDVRQIYLSMERNMKCAIGLCGLCQMGPFFICKDGPVFDYAQVQRFLEACHEL